MFVPCVFLCIRVFGLHALFVNAECLPFNNTLAALDLDHVRVGEKGAMAFADYFGDKRNTTLTALHVAGCSINDNGMRGCLYNVSEEFLPVCASGASASACANPE
jgi:hypothetical protein